MPTSPARVAAFDVLLRVETENAYAVDLLHAERVSKLSQADRNLAMQITMGVLRWQSALDAAWAEHSAAKSDVSRLDPEVRVALRMAAFQLRFLDRVPASAAVNDSVELVKKARKRSAAPFVNAVLRKLAAAPMKPAAEPDSAEAFAGAYAHPLWLVKRWAAAFGMKTAREICNADQSLPITTLRFPLDNREAGMLEDELRAMGIALEPGGLMTSARRVISGDVIATAAYRERRVAIQDEASQLVATLVGRGERILDCCAAPGGKTAAIACRNPEARVVAAELHPQRARAMREWLKAENVEVLDGNIVELEMQYLFDRVLADVPCSGTGTLARNPEIKWRLLPEDLADFNARQSAILSAALDRAAPGARIVYSTCSLEEEENEKVVEEVLRQRPEFRLLEMKDLLRDLQGTGELAWGNVASLTDGAYLRTLPGVHPCDGFFGAVIERARA